MLIARQQLSVPSQESDVNRRNSKEETLQEAQKLFA